jgi:hypothetical protein
MPEQPQNDEIQDLKCPTFPQRIHLSLDLHHPTKEKFCKRFPKVPLKFYLAPTTCYFSAATARPWVRPPASLYPPSPVFRIASSTSRPPYNTCSQLSSDQRGEQDRIANVFIEFQTAWLIYWNAYVDLQNQLYEAIKAARDVSWLAATDTDKLSRLNNSQRELFASMPRRMDYMPLGQINRNQDSALSKLDQLEKAMFTEKEKCLRLMDAIQIIQQKIEIAKKELQNKT